MDKQVMNNIKNRGEVGEREKCIIEVPFDLKGKIYRSPMPFSPYDKSQQLLSEYHQLNIQWVLVLAEQKEMFNFSGRDLLDFYGISGFRVYHFPIPDYQFPNDRDSFDRMIEFILETANSGINLVIHCLAGKGRTGLVLAVMAKKHFNMSGDRAIDWVRNFIPGAIESRQQEKYIREY